MLIPDVPNVSLVAFYGDKPSPLTRLIQELQTYLSELKILQGKFTSYQLEQVHGTIIGCEGLKTASGIISKWFYECRQQTRYLNLPGLINYLQNQHSFPLTIRLGGYDGSCNYGFFSRNQHPFIRSFQLQPIGNEITIPVLIGWSWQNNNISLEMDNLRRNVQQFNLLHKYHQTKDAIDNDFYLRLGTINGKLTPEALNAIAWEIRNILQAKSLDISLDRNNLAFAKYQDLSIAIAKTQIITLPEATADNIEQLY